MFFDWLTSNLLPISEHLIISKIANHHLSNLNEKYVEVLLSFNAIVK